MAGSCYWLRCCRQADQQHEITVAVIDEKCAVYWLSLSEWHHLVVGSWWSRQDIRTEAFDQLQVMPPTTGIIFSYPAAQGFRDPFLPTVARSCST